MFTKAGEVFKFVNCHKPYEEVNFFNYSENHFFFKFKKKKKAERIRIIQRGGTISENNGLCRVNGVLAVSRAFGDLKLKPIVIAEPEIATYQLRGEEVFFL